MFKKHVAASFLAVALLGCADPKVDATTDESMKASIEKVRQSLPEEQRAEFDEALQLLAFSQVDLPTLMAQGAAGASSVTGKMKDAIGGKTGPQIIAEAQRIEAERKERQRVQALAEIQELEEKKAKVAEARASLAKFEVSTRSSPCGPGPRVNASVGLQQRHLHA